MTAFAAEHWPLLATCALALTAGLWTRWAVSDLLSPLLLAVPASCGVGYLTARLAERKP